jgi:hypothetical protein
MRTYKFKLRFIIVIITLIFVSIVPSAVGASYSNPNDQSLQDTIDPDMFDIFDEYLILIDYNEPMNPYILMNYYYQDGSCVRLVYGIPTVNLSLDGQIFDYELIPIFNYQNKIIGWGVKINTRSNLFIFANI